MHKHVCMCVFACLCVSSLNLGPTVCPHYYACGSIYWCFHSLHLPSAESHDPAGVFQHSVTSLWVSWRSVLYFTKAKNRRAKGLNWRFLRFWSFSAPPTPAQSQTGRWQGRASRGLLGAACRVALTLVSPGAANPPAPPPSSLAKLSPIEKSSPSLV